MADEQPLHAADAVGLRLPVAEAVAEGDDEELPGTDAEEVSDGAIVAVAVPLALAPALDEPE